MLSHVHMDLTLIEETYPSPALPHCVKLTSGCVIYLEEHITQSHCNMRLLGVHSLLKHRCAIKKIECIRPTYH